MRCRTGAQRGRGGESESKGEVKHAERRDWRYDPWHRYQGGDLERGRELGRGLEM
jgi:hypothetical protein